MERPSGLKTGSVSMSGERVMRRKFEPSAALTV
jgi:hypothetical protein